MNLRTAVSEALVKSGFERVGRTHLLRHRGTVDPTELEGAVDAARPADPGAMTPGR